MEPNAPVNPTQLKKNHARRMPWRPLALATLLLTVVVLGAVFYQTYRAEKLLKQAHTTTAKTHYTQAYTQLSKANLTLVWPTTSQKIAAAKKQNKQFENYATSMKQANQLIAETKLDEAATALSKINKTFPEYPRVETLRRIITEHKAAKAAQQKADSSPLPGPVQIAGDANCQASTQAALDLLKAKAQTHYTIVQGYLGLIICVPEGSRTFAALKPPQFFAGAATRNAGTVWYAAGLAHEAGHSKLYRDYLAAHPGQPVPDSAWTGEAAEKVCLDAQYDALTKLGGTIFELDAVRNALKTQYYNVKPSEQWW